jgi:hypothetical protein
VHAESTGLCPRPVSTIREQLYIVLHVEPPRILHMIELSMPLATLVTCIVKPKYHGAQPATYDNLHKIINPVDHGPPRRKDILDPFKV